jgi:RecA/RadA recombinase
MTFLKTIVESEKQAQAIKEDAHAAARAQIEKTESEQKAAYVAFEKTLEHERAQKIAAQKETLANTYRTIINDGKIKADALHEQAQERQAAAIKKVLDSLHN